MRCFDMHAARPRVGQTAAHHGALARPCLCLCIYMDAHMYARVHVYMLVFPIRASTHVHGTLYISLYKCWCILNPHA